MLFNPPHERGQMEEEMERIACILFFGALGAVIGTAVGAVLFGVPVWYIIAPAFGWELKLVYAYSAITGAAICAFIGAAYAVEIT